ncbi:Myristoyl-CoA:protein N-myristoyltransferase, N-terminal domain-containing protein [Melampsora americana]|nr:Myristoyl-CoA:protein N-myristoyltransferase, N-terminal domain-containing protein [Melampsora americana]
MASPKPTSQEDTNDAIEYGSEFIRPKGDNNSTEEGIEIEPIHSAGSSKAGPSTNVTEDSETQEGVEGEGEVDQDEEIIASTAGPSSKKNKKKKSKGKASAIAQKLKNSLNGAVSSSSNSNNATGNVSLEKKLGPEGHQLVVDRIRANSGDAIADQVAALGPAELGRMLDNLRLLDVMQGKNSGKNKKDMADHKFWATQPVLQLDEQNTSFEEGEIEPNKPGDEIRQTPLTLPDGYEWCSLDLGDEIQLREVYELLTGNYVEDDDAMFRFDYTAPFIRWALQPPNFVQDWHVGVRVASGKRRLIAFIAGVPMHLKARSTVKDCSEINFLCIHKKLRAKRLAPVLIKEITRRCNIRGIFQAIYTAGIFLPTPISRCQYFHRNLNPAKLIATGFSSQPRGVSIARLKRMYECPTEPLLPGFREMVESDVSAVGILLRRYMSRYDLQPILSDDEVRHNFISGRGKGDPIDRRREEQVAWSFVAENPENHTITDFVSFYHLPSTAMNSTPHQTIDAAYLFYYATTSVPSCANLFQSEESENQSNQLEKEPNWMEESAEDRLILKKRLITLIGDALIMAQQAKFDVFNALTLMDNSLFVKELQFGAGDGFLHYYLYNWKVHQIQGGVLGEGGSVPGSEGSTESPTGERIGSGVGVVML